MELIFDQEIISMDSSEVLDLAEVLNPADDQQISVLLVDQNMILVEIQRDLRLVMLFVLLTFCWSGIRSWRRSMGRGAKK